MKSGRIKKYLKTGVKLKLFERKQEFWNLFENWDLENYLKIGISKIKFKNYNFESYVWKKLEFWTLEFRRLN